MKGLKSAVFFFFSTMAVYADAAYVSLTFGGYHTSYSATVPGLPNLAAKLDPVQPLLKGALNFNPDSGWLVFGGFTEPYHNVEFFNGSTDVVATASFPYNGRNFSISSSSYDPNTFTLSGTGYMDFNDRGVDPFCVGLVAVCAGIFEIEPVRAYFELSLIFADAAFSAFTGTGSFTTTFSNGTVISSEYLFDTAVPIPAAAWLFGSAVVGLAGARRLRRAPC